jgi:hypothetical protein
MVPGEESVDFAIGPAGGDAFEGYFEPGLRIDVVEFGGREQCGEGCPNSSAAADQRRRGVSGLASRRETSASINSKLLVLDLCSDCKSFLSNQTAERSNITELSVIRYTGPPDRLPSVVVALP